MARYSQLEYAKIATWMPEALPDFMCIGAPRAATTWLYHQLRVHPDCFLPKIKELRFFDQPVTSDYSDGTDLVWDESFFFDVSQPAHWRWYWLQFRKAQGRLKGEITPGYCALSKDRVDLIKASIPDLKLIYIIRNPVDVVWSTVRKVIWYQKGRQQLERYPTDVLLRSAFHPANLRWGEFDKNIHTWEARFDQDEILYLLFDDLAAEPSSQLNRVCRFLGASPLVDDDSRRASSRINAAPPHDMPAEIREALVSRFADTVKYLERKLERDLGHWVVTSTEA